MHQENLVGKINGEATTERPRTEFETAMFNAEKQRLTDAVGNLEAAAKERAPQTIREAVAMCAQPLSTLTVSKVPASPEDELVRLSWTLHCLTEGVRYTVFHLSTTEQNENARLALRHLEDAQHRLKLAQSSESTTVSSDKQKIENLARQCLRNAEIITDLRAKLE